MKVKELIAHSHLIKDQYIVVEDVRNLQSYSSKDIGRYNFGRNQELVLKMKVNCFETTEFGIRIFAE